MSETETTTIHRVELLHGHVSPETAYVVEDYPYGRALRCQKRFWVETATKGAKKGQQRMVGQTTNPKEGDRWNKPHPGQYSLMVFMYVDPENGHVHEFEVSEYGITPEGHYRFLLMGLYAQVTMGQRAQYGMSLAASRRHEEPWRKWNEILLLMDKHYREHGIVPELTERGGRLVGYEAVTDPYVGSYVYPVAKAWVLSLKR